LSTRDEYIRFPPRNTTVCRSRPTNAISFDLEHWYTATLVRESVTDPTDRVEQSVQRVLDVLDDHDVAATFFVVGEVAEAFPDLLAHLAAAGHELATHGHTHTPLTELDRREFRSELDRSVAAIEEATDVAVRGFRAPNFSVCHETDWAFEVIADAGLTYDSSVFPSWTPMYGVRSAPVGPYRVDPHHPFEKGGSGGALLEAPVAVHPRFRVPVAGGFYARTLPTRVLEWGIEALNARGLPAVLYFHPWEFNPAVRSSAPPAHARFVSYHGIERTADVLARLLERYAFDTVAGAVTDSV
jgi:polysaccharide deacetylase family protein (PEP-CTERM system associated)